MANKYGAKPTTIDNIRFMSKGEANRYLELKLLLKQGIIRDLKLQPRFPIKINGIKVCDVVLDFEYYYTASNKRIIEDFKGCDTAMSKLKRKMVQAEWGIEVHIV